MEDWLAQEHALAVEAVKTESGERGRGIRLAGPFDELLYEFRDAAARYPAPRCTLLVLAVDEDSILCWGREPRPRYRSSDREGIYVEDGDERVGFARLPIILPDGSTCADYPCVLYLRADGRKSKRALKLFKELGERAGALLPQPIRDAITPGMEATLAGGRPWPTPENHLS